MATRPDNWKAVKALFEAALEEDSARRSSFLEERCADAILRAEVERLLAEHEQAGGFLSTAALADVPFGAEVTASTQRLSENELLADRFRIIRFIAGGGMGEVYEAEDQELRERVAVKIIRAEILAEPNAVARFKREVHLARKVTHPNVCRIFDLFRHRPDKGTAQEEIVFVSMELLAGKTLGVRLKQGGRMSMAEALPLVQQMASALAAAHAVGIVHRDFKPGNVVLVGIPERGGERAVVTDFGLALQSLVSDETVSVSSGRGLAGTPAYMSPEQIEGHLVTTASDIYALGLVMYEMVTGMRPFQGDSRVSAAIKRLSRPPTPPRMFAPQLDRAWESVILRCLERQPSKRFASVREVINVLDGQFLHSVTKRKRSRTIDALAVLPFTRDKEHPDTEYLADGITENLINLLSQLPGLRVMARATVFRYKDAATDSLSVGRELGVDAIVMGRIEQRDENLIVATELVDVSDGSVIWGRRYTNRLATAREIEQKIAKDISRKMRPRLLQKKRDQLFKRYTGNTEAYHLYLRGRFYWNQRTDSGLRKGIQYFQMAIAKDNKYALAYAGLSDCFQLLGGYRILAPEAAFSQAKVAATSALSIDKRLPEAHTSLALATLYFDWNWSRAEKEFRLAIRLGPNYPTAHQWYTHYLMATGRRAEALASIERAHQLDPLSLGINTHLGWAFYFLRRFDEAVDQLSKTIELDPRYVLAHFVSGQCNAQLGRFSEAVSELQLAASLSDRLPPVVSALAHTYGLMGDTSGARTLMEELRTVSFERYVSSYDIALVRLGLGEKDLAIDMLERAFSERVSWMIWVKAEPALDSLRSYPRFQEIIQRVGFP